MATRKKRTAPTARRKTSKKKSSWLHSLLFILIVLLSLTAIAFAASYVYQRMSTTNTTTKEIINESEEIGELPLYEDPTEIEALQATQEKASSQDSKKSILEGTWVSEDNGVMLTISGGTFTLDLPSVEGSKPLKGTISVNKNLFTIISAGEKSVCKDLEGSYKFELSGEDLKIKIVSDGCSERSSQLNASWFKM